MSGILITLIVALILFFVYYVYLVVREMAFAEKVKTYDVSDFNIETKEVTIKRLKDDIIINKELIKPLQGDDYYNLDILIGENERYDNWIYLTDSVYKETHKVSLKDYKAYKKYTKDYDYVELKGYSLILSLKDTNKSLFRGKIKMLRADIPYICPCATYTDEEIKEIVECVKKEIIKKVCRRI